MEPEISFPCLQESAFPRLCVKFRNKLGSYGEEVTVLPNPHARGPPLVDCLQIFIQYIRSYVPYQAAVSSIRNPRTRHAMVTGAHITWPMGIIVNKFKPYIGGVASRAWCSYQVL